MRKSQVYLKVRKISRWTNETEFYPLILKQYPDAIYQYRTSWLGKQSLAIYIPSIRVGFEYQGIQHFEPVDFFGGTDGLESTQKRDKIKKQQCKANKVILIYWNYTTTYTKNETANIVIQAVINALAPIIIIVIQYVAFTSSGFQVRGTGYEARIPTWLHTSVLILFITPFIARKIYTHTSNPYLGGMINGLLVTLCMSLNSTFLMGPGV